MNQKLSKTLLTAVLWSFIGRFGYLTIGLISNVILVRLLSPKEFGQIGIVIFFIGISTVLIESGLSGALIRKKNTTEKDYSTVFIFNLFISLILMLILINYAKYIANYFNDNELKEILIASSFVFIINAIRITQTTKLIKAMDFKKKACFDFFAILTGSTIAIFMANKGAGVWSLISLQLSISITLTTLYWLYLGPLKTYKFSYKSFKELYIFGINTTLASLLNTFFENIYQLLLGKYFSINQTGYFYQAKKLQEMSTSILESIMSGAVYSALSRIQDEPIKFNYLYHNTVKILTIISSLICMVIYFYSDTIIYILYGEEWITSAFYLKLLTIASFFYLQEIFNRVIFKIFNRTGKILQLEILKKAIQSLTIIYGITSFSIENLLYGFIATNIISFIINYHYARRIQKNFNYKDLYTIIQIMLTSILVIIICNYFTYNNETYELKKLLTLPLMISLNFILLHSFKIINIKNTRKTFKFLTENKITPK